MYMYITSQETLVKKILMKYFILHFFHTSIEIHTHTPAPPLPYTHHNIYINQYDSVKKK